jgi:hypothetical protein
MSLAKLRAMVDAQNVLGAKWPHNEYKLTEIGDNDWRFVLQTPSEYAKPWFTDPVLRIIEIARTFK